MGRQQKRDLCDFVHLTVNNGFKCFLNENSYSLASMPTLATDFHDLQVWNLAYMEEIFGMTHISHASLRVGAWAGNKKALLDRRHNFHLQPLPNIWP